MPRLAFTARQIIGVLLIGALLIGTAAWVAHGRPMPELPAISAQAPETPAVRPLGTLEPWAQALASQAANGSALPATVTVAGRSARVERHGKDAILCPPRTGGCLLLRTGHAQVITAYGPDARATLRARTKTP